MNTFLEAHRVRINKLHHVMQEFKARNSPESGNVPINDILFLIKGLSNEIEKLQEALDKSNKELNTYKNITHAMDK